MAASRRQELERKSAPDVQPVAAVFAEPVRERLRPAL
jgi:hypothetical protein